MNMTPSKYSEVEIDKENLEMLYERRNVLDQARVKHSDALDKYLLTFATGSLYLSINFTNDIAKDLHSKCLLFTGWVFLLLSIVTILISFYFGEKAHEIQIEINDKQIEKIYEGKDHLSVDASNVWNKRIKCAKIFSATTFIVGVACLTYFYFINL